MRPTHQAVCHRCPLNGDAIVVALLTKEFLNIFTTTGFSANGNHIIWQATLMELTLIVASLRAWWIPFTAAHGQTWTTKCIDNERNIIL